MFNEFYCLYLQSVRNEFLGILSTLVRQFDNVVFEDLRILVDKDPETDFFENMRHIQVQYYYYFFNNNKIYNTIFNIDFKINTRYVLLVTFRLPKFKYLHQTID